MTQDPPSSARTTGATPSLSLDRLLENLPGAAYRCRIDPDWTMQFISEGIAKLTGYPPDAFLPPARVSFGTIIHPDDRDPVEVDILDAVAHGRPFTVTYRIISASGELKWMCEQGSAVSGPDGRAIALEGYITDVTPVKQNDMLVMEQASLLDKASDAIFVMDMTGRITYWNKGAERLYGWEAGETLGQRVCELLCTPRDAFEAARSAALAEGEWTGELPQCRRDGSQVETETRWTLLHPDPQFGTNRKILVIGTDIGERKHHEARIHRLAFYDPLTDLHNRASLLDHLHQALLGSARSGKYGALLFCDLDNFKTLNDTHGHGAGDLLLQAVARRLEHSVREADMVARLGGDEFVILLQWKAP